MRARITAIALLLPLVAGAQRRTAPRPLLPGMPQHDGRTELPKSAPGISAIRQIPWKYRMVSFESYPFVAVMSTSNYLQVGSQSFSSLGFGGRMDMRIVPSLSFSIDGTQTMLGGPFNMSTIEAGFRLRPWVSGRTLPWASASWAAAYTQDRFNNTNAYVGAPVGASPYSNGSGLVAGVGFEQRLTRRFSINVGMLATRFDMTARDYSRGFSQWDYKATGTRIILGMKYNPIRWVTDVP